MQTRSISRSSSGFIWGEESQPLWMAWEIATRVIPSHGPPYLSSTATWAPLLLLLSQVHCPLSSSVAPTTPSFPGRASLSLPHAPATFRAWVAPLTCPPRAFFARARDLTRGLRGITGPPLSLARRAIISGPFLAFGITCWWIWLKIANF